MHAAWSGRSGPWDLCAWVGLLPCLCMPPCLALLQGRLPGRLLPPAVVAVGGGCTLGPWTVTLPLLSLSLMLRLRLGLRLGCKQLVPAWPGRGRGGWSLHLLGAAAHPGAG